MFAVDFSRLYVYLAIAFVIPIIVYIFFIMVALPRWQRFLIITLPGLLTYFSGCFLAYLFADQLLNMLRIPGSAYIFASIFVFALVLIYNSVWAIRKIKKEHGI